MNFESILHERIEYSRKGENPTTICKMRSGWLVLGDEQRLRGYCLLLADPIVPSINVLTDSERTEFLSDMVLVGDALLSVCEPKPYRINYEIAGNTFPWLHAHITPRYDFEEIEKRMLPPIVYTNDPSVPFDDARDRGLISSINKYLESQGMQG